MIPHRSTDEPRVRDRWRHGGVAVLGLIGGIGGGKSSVARRLAALGAAVIDADAVGHELLEDLPIRDRIVARFGPGVLADGRISRKALGAIVFHDPEALRDLESILHPAMRERFIRTIGRLAGEGGPPCIVLDAAVLLEAGWDDLCDRIAFVDAPRADRLERVRESRGWSEEALAAREAAQMPIEEKRRRADWIIDNEGPLSHLDREADRLLGRLRAEAAIGAPPGLRETA